MEILIVKVHGMPATCPKGTVLKPSHIFTQSSQKRHKACAIIIIPFLQMKKAGTWGVKYLEKENTASVVNIGVLPGGPCRKNAQPQGVQSADSFQLSLLQHLPLVQRAASPVVTPPPGNLHPLPEQGEGITELPASGPGLVILP